MALVGSYNSEAQNDNAPVSGMNGITLALAPALLGAMMVAPLPVVPLMVKAFGGQDRLVTLALTIPILTAALSGIALAVLGNRVSRRSAFIAGALIFSIAGPAPVLLDSLSLILISRGVAGLALGTMMNAGLGLVADFYEGERRTFWLAAQSSIPAGAVIGAALVAGWLGAWGWRAPFALLAVGTVVFVLSIRLARPTASVTPLPRALIQSSPARLLFPILLVGSTGSLLIYYPAYEFGFVLKEQHLESSFLVGGMTSAIGVGAILGASALAKLGQLSPLKGASICLLSACAGQLGVALAQSHILLILAALVTGFGQGLFVPALSQWLLGSVLESARGRSIAVFQTVLLVSQFSAPQLARTVANTFGSAASGMTLLGALAGLYSLLLLLSGFRPSLTSGDCR